MNSYEEEKRNFVQHLCILLQTIIRILITPWCNYFNDQNKGVPCEDTLTAQFASLNTSLHVYLHTFLLQGLCSEYWYSLQITAFLITKILPEYQWSHGSTFKYTKETNKKPNKKQQQKLPPKKYKTRPTKHQKHPQAPFSFPSKNPTTTKKLSCLSCNIFLLQKCFLSFEKEMYFLKPFKQACLYIH